MDRPNPSAAESASEVSAALGPRTAELAADIYQLIVRVFLQENGSYKATAERLVLHKNTVQYRVRKAEETLRHPIVQDRLRTELALLAAQWLGPAVLRSAGSP